MARVTMILAERTIITLSILKVFGGLLAQIMLMKLEEIIVILRLC